MDLGKYLQAGPKMGPQREESRYIDIDCLVADERNFYALSDIDALADNIELIGLQQPIRVREISGEPGRYRIVSGHRRRSALQKLVDEGREQFRDVHCIVETVECSEAMQELRLIYANSDTRKMSPMDLSRQAQRVEALLYQLKEEGFEFPGRMRDHVAQACQTSKSKLSRLKVIREHLYSAWMPYFERNELNEACAYALAQMTEENQRKIYSAKMSSKNTDLRYFYESTVKVHKDYLDALEKLECESCGGHCQNTDAKYHHMAANSYSYNLCHKKCCDKCQDLATCKQACPRLAEKVKQLKADKKAAKQQEKIAKEAEAAPKIQLLSDLWERFGIARAAAKVSVKEYKQAIGSHYYVSSDDREYQERENCHGITEMTTMPYGFSFGYTEAKKLINTADCLGVSLDYLFCRTDQPFLPKLPDGQLVFNGWMPGGTNPATPCEAVAVFDLGGRHIKRICRWNGRDWVFEQGGAKIEMQVLKWMALPEEN